MTKDLYEIFVDDIDDVFDDHLFSEELDLDFLEDEPGEGNLDEADVFDDHVTWDDLIFNFHEEN